MTDRLLTILQTAQQFNLTAGLLYAAVATGDLVAIRFRPRGHIRLREADVRDWIEDHAARAQLPTRRPNSLQGGPAAAADIEQFLPPAALRRFTG